MKKQYYYIALSLSALIMCMIFFFSVRPPSIWATMPSSTQPLPLPEIPEQYPFFIYDNGRNNPVLPVPGSSSGRIVKIEVETMPDEVYFYYQGPEAWNEPYGETVRFKGSLDIDYQTITEARSVWVSFMGERIVVTREEDGLILFDGAGVEAWGWEIELEPGIHVATFRVIPAEPNARGHDLPPLEFFWYFTVVE
jgi:hypothetical protein